jgi:hypothetical protein
MTKCRISNRISRLEPIILWYTKPKANWKTKLPKTKEERQLGSREWSTLKIAYADLK